MNVTKRAYDRRRYVTFTRVHPLICAVQRRRRIRQKYLISIRRREFLFLPLPYDNNCYGNQGDGTTRRGSAIGVGNPNRIRGEILFGSRLLR